MSNPFNLPLIRYRPDDPALPQRSFQYRPPESPIAIPQQREADFRAWYEANRGDLAPNPDDPDHHYDWRKAYAAGVTPAIDPGDQLPHWPSTFKSEDHPNRFVSGVDTHTGLPVDPGAMRGVSPLTLPAVDPFSAMSRIPPEQIAAERAAKLDTAYYGRPPPDPRPSFDTSRPARRQFTPEELAAFGPQPQSWGSPITGTGFPIPSLMPQAPGAIFEPEEAYDRPSPPRTPGEMAEELTRFLEQAPTSRPLPRSAPRAPVKPRKLTPWGS